MTERLRFLDKEKKEPGYLFPLMMTEPIDEASTYKANIFKSVICKLVVAELIHSNYHGITDENIHIGGPLVYRAFDLVAILCRYQCEISKLNPLARVMPYNSYAIANQLCSLIHDDYIPICMYSPVAFESLPDEVGFREYIAAQPAIGGTKFNEFLCDYRDLIPESTFNDIEHQISLVNKLKGDNHESN